jgi:anti-sigma factor RsiW
MELQNESNKCECPWVDICAYVDGELSPDRELELELHMAECRDCAEELNQQKALLCALSASQLSQDEIELPKNFTKVVVANAESRVGGLRGRSERFNAAAISFTLLLLALLALGADARNEFTGLFSLAEKIAAVAFFTGHLAYDVAIGTIVILRTLTGQFVTPAAASMLISALLAASIFTLSRLVLRADQIKESRTAESD